MKYFALVLTVGLTIGLMTGCGMHSAEDVRQQQITHDSMMSDLMTYSMTDREVENQVMRIMILDGRGFVEDNLHFWLMEQPSALSMYPVH